MIEVESYRGELLAHARRIVGTKEDAEDCVQDALVGVVTKPPTNLHPKALRKYLYLSVKTKCIDVLRSRKYVYSEGDQMDRRVSPKQWADDVICNEALASAPEKVKDAIKHIEWNNSLPFGTKASHDGYSTTTTWRAKKRIKAWMGLKP